MHLPIPDFTILAETPAIRRVENHGGETGIKDVDDCLVIGGRFCE
jgi:hypothetical protein